MHDWIATLSALQSRHTAAVLVTVAAVKGSAPRPAGTKMIVSANAVHGTIGGGHLEFSAIDIARKQLDADGPSAPNGDGAPGLRRFPLGASLGQCCGGVVNLLFEPVSANADWVATLAQTDARSCAFVVVTPAHGALPGGKLLVMPDNVRGTIGDHLDDEAAHIARTLIAGSDGSRIVTLPVTSGTARDAFFFDVVRPSGFPIVLFGAGHVGRALVSVLANLPCTVAWVDSRDDAFPDVIPANVERIVTDAPEAEVDRAPALSYFLVMTHEHALDERLTERILRGTEFAYLGLIGSLTKRRQFERRLAARGATPAMLERIVCPIGIEGISGKEPGVIAVAVAAELLQRRALIESRKALVDGAAPALTG
ncbi:MAG: xanthine dehydrogenase accessory protein XdhC [Betaproteobacteria bacterium]